MVAICCPTNWPTTQPTPHVTVLYLGKAEEQKTGAATKVKICLEELHPQFPDMFWVRAPRKISWFNPDTPVLELAHPYFEGMHEILYQNLVDHFDLDEWSDTMYDWVNRFPFNPHLTLTKEEARSPGKIPNMIQLVRPKLWWKGWQ